MLFSIVLVILAVVVASHLLVESYPFLLNAGSKSKQKFLETTNKLKDVSPEEPEQPQEEINKELVYSDDAIYLDAVLRKHSKDFIKRLPVHTNDSIATIDKNLNDYKDKFICLINKVCSDSFNSQDDYHVLRPHFLKVNTLLSNWDYALKEDINSFIYIHDLAISLQYILKLDLDKDTRQYMENLYYDYLYNVYKSLLVYYTSIVDGHHLYYHESKITFQGEVKDRLTAQIQAKAKELDTFRKGYQKEFLKSNFNFTSTGLAYKFSKIESLMEIIIKSSEDISKIETKVTVSKMKETIIPKIKVWSEDKNLSKKDSETLSLVLDKILVLLNGYESEVYNKNSNLTDELSVIDRYIGYLNPSSELQ